MPTNTFYTDYKQARSYAQAEANQMGGRVLIRLRNVTEYGRKGCVYNYVPAKVDDHFGRDMEGELVLSERIAIDPRTEQKRKDKIG